MEAVPGPFRDLAGVAMGMYTLKLSVCLRLCCAIHSAVYAAALLPLAVGGLQLGEGLRRHLPAWKVLRLTSLVYGLNDAVQRTHAPCHTLHSRTSMNFVVLCYLCSQVLFGGICVYLRLISAGGSSVADQKQGSDATEARGLLLMMAIMAPVHFITALVPTPDRRRRFSRLLQGRLGGVGRLGDAQLEKLHHVPHHSNVPVTSGPGCPIWPHEIADPRAQRR